jgi:uncharacterized membrane protein
MAFCPNCGTQVDGKFCPKCGTPIAAGGTTPPPGATPQGTYTPPPDASVQSAGMTDNMAAALCYLVGLITGVLFLVLEPYNKNKTIRFHAFQSIFLNVAWIAAWIVVSILSVGLLVMGSMGLMLISLLHLVLGLGFLVLWVFLMYKAYNNEKFVLPIIGPLAEKQA